MGTVLGDKVPEIGTSGEYLEGCSTGSASGSQESLLRKLQSCSRAELQHCDYLSYAHCAFCTTQHVCNDSTCKQAWS